MALRLLLFLLLAIPAWANFVPNSSFELGASRGWFLYETAGSAYLGSEGSNQSYITNTAQHGTYSMLLPSLARLQSRGIYLTSGSYVLTFYMKTFSGLQGPYFMSLMNGSELDQSPSSIGNVTGSFLRYTGSVFTATSNGIYWIKALNFQPICAIDAVQIDAGTTPTDYAPMSTVELGMTCLGTNNMFFAGDTPTVTMNFWNEGGPITTRYGYDVYDLWNSNVLSVGRSVTLAGAGLTRATVPLPNRNGALRVVSRLHAYNESHDEMTVVVYPYATNLNANATNEWLGGHANGSVFQAALEKFKRRPWTRLLSPNYRNTRWWNASPNTAESVEPTRGSFSFIDSYLTNQAATGISMIGNLTPADGIWTQWATNSDGTWDRPAWSNYCYVVVNRFKTWVHTWEIGPNEPYQTGPWTNINGLIGGTLIADSLNGEPYTGTNQPAQSRVATNYADFLSVGLSGVTNADPTARIIGVAGAYGAGEWALIVWNALTANIKSWVSVISTHLYPQDQGLDPNDADYSPGHFSNPNGWIERFGGIRDVWNTESGIYSRTASTLKGWNGMFPNAYSLATSYDPGAESLRAASMTAQLTEALQISQEALRCIGLGFRKYFYYDTRAWNDAAYREAQVPYAADYQNVDRPEIVTLSIARHMVEWGFGPWTNTTISVYVEGYVYTNLYGQVVLTGWNTARTNLLMTADNGEFAVYDVMGNLIQTNSTSVRITRVPQYFVSGTRTMTQLSNTFTFSPMVDTPDNLPPQLSWDIAPSGPWSGSASPTLIKWTGIDDTWTAWATNSVTAPTATNVLFKYRLDNASYGSYSQSNLVWLSNLSSGNHSFYVTAKDRVGNTAEYRYDFVPPVSTINVSATANIGSITVP